MKKAMKSKWLKALRSGRYKQTTGALYRRSRRAHCCLGVLCRVAGVPFRNGYFDYGGETEDCFLPPSLASEIGLRKSTQTSLARKNDKGVSFIEIADYIEKRL